MDARQFLNCLLPKKQGRRVTLNWTNPGRRYLVASSSTTILLAFHQSLSTCASHNDTEEDLLESDTWSLWLDRTSPGHPGPFVRHATNSSRRSTNAGANSRCPSVPQWQWLPARAMGTVIGTVRWMVRYGRVIYRHQTYQKSFYTG